MRNMKLVLRLLGLPVILTAFSLPVSANSAQTQWRGVDSSGPVLADQDCPVVVERENLTFELMTFPDGHSASTEQNPAYDGRVTAEYEFFNPADYTVQMKLLFPFGAEPSYSYSEETDILKYQITAAGQPVKKKLRYSYLEAGRQFDLTADLALLQDGWAEDAFYSPDMPVEKFVYEISGLDETNTAANAALDLPAFDGARMVYFTEQSGSAVQENDTARVSAWAKNGDHMTVYVIGEPFETMPQWTFYKDGGVENGTEIAGTAVLLEQEQMTFKDFALRNYPQNSPETETDWYNAVLASYRAQSYEGAPYIFNDTWPEETLPQMRWYEYELEIGPGEHLINTVEAPVYPSIDARETNTVYGYTYLLSPAATWARFSNLHVEIHTPYLLSASSVGDFEKTDTGYRFTSSELPEEELTFNLSEKAPAAERKGPSYLIFTSIAIVALVVWLRKRA